MNPIQVSGKICLLYLIIILIIGSVSALDPRVTVTQTIAPLNTSDWNTFRESYGGDEPVNDTSGPDWSTMVWTPFRALTTPMGQLGIMVLIITPFVGMWLNSGSSQMIAVLGAIFGTYLLARFPPEYRFPAVGMFALAILAIMYHLYKERSE